MKLYGAAISPFVARVRIACAAKGIAVDLVPPPGGIRSAEFLAINPIGKIPVLVDGETTIAESETILDYLDDRFLTPPLRPADPIGRARMRTIIRVTDTYLTAPIARCFVQLDPATRDTAVTAGEIDRWRQGAILLAGHVTDAPYALGTSLTLADCVVPPSLLLSGIISSILGIDDPVAAHPDLGGYAEKVSRHPAVAQAISECEQAIAATRS